MPYVRILGFVTLLLRLVAAAAPVLAATPMPADQAFQFRAQLDEEEGVELIWSIAPDYYLYRDRIVVTLDGQRIRIATEKGEPKDDPNFGMTEVYHARYHGDRSGGTVAGEGPHHRHLSGLRREYDLLSADFEGGRSCDVAHRRCARGQRKREPGRRLGWERHQRSPAFRHGGPPRRVEPRRKPACSAAVC